MTHLITLIKFSGIFLLLFFIHCSILNAQNLVWKQPIHAGYECFNVSLDSNNFLYSTCESRTDGYVEYFDSTAVPTTLTDGRSIFVAKSDTNNVVQWLKVIESSWAIGDPIMGISPSQKVIISSNVWDQIICDPFGMSFPDHNDPPFFILQLDSSGNFDWINLIQHKHQFGYMKDVAFDSENNIYLTGICNDTITFGDLDCLWQWTPTVSFVNPDGESSFIAKYSQNGKFISAKLIPIVNTQGGAYLWLNSIIIDSENNLYATGWFDGTIEYGNTTISSVGVEILILKFNENMEVVWSKHFGPGNPYTIQQGNSLAFDKEKKNFYVTGNFIGNKDFGNGLVQSNDKNIFLAKYSLDGTLKWIRQFGNWSGLASYTEEGQELFVDENDFVYVGGIFYSTLQIGDTAIEAYYIPNISNTYSDIFIAKYFANGDFSWAAHAGNDHADELGALVKDKFNHIYVGGQTSPGTHFDDYTIVISPGDIGQRGFLACFNDRPENNKYESTFGIEDSTQIDYKIKIFPNPFLEKFEIEIQNTEYLDIYLKLIDLNSRTVLTDFIKAESAVQSISYNLEELPAGIYCLKIALGSNLCNFKIVKL